MQSRYVGVHREAQKEMIAINCKNSTKSKTVPNCMVDFSGESFVYFGTEVNSSDLNRNMR